MIITRTPFRISFFGGGTDYPAYYLKHGGSVLSTTINKYCYITLRNLPPFFKYNYLIRYRFREEHTEREDIQHPSVRHCLQYMGVNRGVEVVHTSDLPARSGIGSSSAFTVGLLHGLTGMKGKILTKRQLAGAAIHVEQNLIKENVGSQDQVAVAFGGFNRVDFNCDGTFYVQPMTIPEEKLVKLQDHLMFFYTGQSRIAEEIAAEQVSRMETLEERMSRMKGMVERAIDILNTETEDITRFGELLHEAWEIKSKLTNRVSSKWVDKLYTDALGAGAIGGKLCGAGGGGFLLLFVPPENQEAVKRSLDSALYVPFRFENLGSQVIFYEYKEF